MITVRQSLRGTRRATDINISPLIDLVFLLLIFFIVTTSFVKETGVDVQRPVASTAVPKEKSTILIGVTAEGRIFFDRKEIDIRSVRAHVERSLAENPETGVIIVADKKSHTGTVIKVLDECRIAKAKKISIAASREASNE